MPETKFGTTDCGDPITIYLPFEARRKLRGQLPDDQAREYEGNHTGLNSSEAEWILQSAILDWMAEELGYNPERTELTARGDFQEIKPRATDGTFAPSADE